MTWRYRLSLGVAGLLVPLFIAAAVGIDMNAGRATDWLPQRSPARIEYDRFVRQFGVDDYVILSWPGCTLDEPCVEELAQALRGSPAGSGMIKQVTTGPQVLQELTTPPLRLSRDEALRRLEGVFVGPDHATTCLSIRMEGTAADRPKAFDLICRTAEEVCGLTRTQLRLAGSIYDVVALNEASRRTVQFFAVPAGLVSLLIAGLFLRNVRMTVAIFAVSVFCQLMAIGVLDISLGRMNVLLIVMPTLVYVLAMSSAVHLLNYCLDASRTIGLLRGVPQGLHEGRTPCVLAAVTTAIGLLSLCVSQIRPVQEFGLSAAVCIILSLAVLFLLLPACLLWGADLSQAQVRSRPPKFSRQAQFALNRIGELVIRHPVVIAAASLLLLLVCSCGLLRLQTRIDFDRMFPADSELVRNFEWLEEHVGPLVPIELLIEIPVDSHLTALERVELVGDVEQAVGRIPGVTAALSAATFVPPHPTTYRLGDVLQRRIRAQRIEEQLPKFVEDGLLALDGDRQRWRITFRLPAQGEWDYLALSQAAEAEGQAVIDLQVESAGEGITVTSTGMMPLNAETDQLLFQDLARSYLLAFTLICPLMMLILRGVCAGFLAMIPNVAPTLLVFGLMGWADIPVEIGTMLCASVALGIAVDDTVHFLTWYRRGLAEGQPNVAAVRFAYDRCALAMVQTTLIGGSGMLVFGLSDFVPASRFAVILALLLVTALMGDLVILPALLCSPLGRIFVTGRGRHRYGKSVPAALLGDVETPIDPRK